MRVRRGQCLAGAVALALLGASREADAQSRPALSTRDSAGIRIATIQDDPWAAPAWASLDTVKVFRIDPDDARPETLFGRVGDAVRLSDGRIVVLDQRRVQALLFARDGSLLRTIGRRGQGPGEFRYPLRLLRVGTDSIGIVDDDRVEIFPLGRGDPRRIRMPAAERGHYVQALGILADRGYLTLAQVVSVDAVVGRHSMYAALAFANLDGTPGRVLGRHLAGEYTYRAGGSDGPMEVATLFWEDPAGAALPSGYVWCLSTRFECAVWSIDEGYVRSIRSTALPRAVTRADVDALTAEWLRGLRTRADSVENRQAIALAHRMERIPVLSDLRTDARGRIWMRAYQARENQRTIRWLVFEATGQVLGTVTTPAGLRVRDIGDDYLLGVERDEDDAERIAMYRYTLTR